MVWFRAGEPKKPSLEPPSLGPGVAPSEAVESYEDEDAWRKKCLEEELLGEFIGKILWIIDDITTGWWWLEHDFYCSIYLEWYSQLTNIFQTGWNHQPEYYDGWYDR